MSISHKKHYNPLYIPTPYFPASSSGITYVSVCVFVSSSEYCLENFIKASVEELCKVFECSNTKKR